VIVLYHNDGPVLLSTTYWSTPNAANGLFHMSPLAGTLRLLVPAPAVHQLDELPPVGTRCDLTRMTIRGHRAYRLRWHDDPANPFALDLAEEQSAIPIPTGDDGRVFPLVWYAQDGAEGVREVRREAIQIGTTVAS
jgi:hypothetical protein